jgi:hypothetical protein
MAVLDTVNVCDVNALYTNAFFFWVLSLKGTKSIRSCAFML